MKIGPVVSPFSNNVSNLNAKKGRPLTDSEVLGYAKQYGIKSSGSRNIDRAVTQRAIEFKENATSNLFKTNINTDQSTAVQSQASGYISQNTSGQISNLEELQKQFSALQSKYSNNNVQLPAAVQAKLSELGLTSTGSYEGDMANIQNNLAAQNAASIQNPYYLNPNYILWFGR